MEHPVRIAGIGPLPDRLLGDLRALPDAPEVRLFPSLYGDSEALQAYQPTLLVVALAPGASEELGALRLLRGFWPGIGVVVVTGMADEVAMTPVAAGIGAHLLVHPGPPGSLPAAIEHALHGSRRPRREEFVDLAHGVADEVNNPLLSVAGQLQLLRASFDPNGEANRRAQVDAALDGVRRIQDAVDRLRLLSAAANGPRRPEPIDVPDLLRQALAASPALLGDDHPVQWSIEAGGIVPGDRDLLAEAMRALAACRAGLAHGANRTSLEISTTDRAVRFVLLASGSGLAQWRLPQTFEPYYPTRLLRGAGHGLSWAIVQAVVLGHRGQATARRRHDGQLQFEFLLPR